MTIPLPWRWGDNMAGEEREELGTLFVVGIGPGHPDHLTRRAEAVLREADCVIAADLYQEFLRSADILPPASAVIEDTSGWDGEDAGATDESAGTVLARPDGGHVEIRQSSMGSQQELAREAFARVRDGQDVVQVSGGDATVYGKADLILSMAREEAATDIPIEIIPGVTAALGGAASLGAPLSNDFCTVSLSTKWRDWSEIETKLRASAVADFVIVLYNCWRNYDETIEVIREERHDSAPVAILTDIGRGDLGRTGEDTTITTLGAAPDHAAAVGGMGTAILIGTTDTSVFETDLDRFLLTPRGENAVEEF